MKNCIVCEKTASLYCACDDAFLCQGCDQQVHSANLIAMRHKRVPICELCLSGPSEVYCKNDTAFLCSSCDESSHQGFMMRHERIPAEQAQAQDARSAAPSTVPAESEGDSHLFQVPSMPMMVPPGVEDFPDWNDISGPLDAKALLGKDFSNDLDIFDADPSWLDRLDMGFDSITQNMLEGVVPEFDNFGKESSGKNSFANNLDLLDMQHDNDLPKSAHVPVSQPEPTPLPDLYDPTLQFDFSATPFVSEQQHQQVQKAPAKPMFASERVAFRCEASNLDIASFVPPSLRPVDAHTLAERSLDRRMRLARYREKKKNRQFKKTIRYASRKAYAEVRPRIKGRFARKDEVVAMRAAGILPCA